VWEVTSRKVGNVHRYADFDNVTYLDFLLSSRAAADALSLALTEPIGRTIHNAVTHTRQVTETNTNLGIVLLLAPLARGVGGDESDDRKEIRRVLQSLTVNDAHEVYTAIREAHPGGLGEAPEQDVRNEPTVTLLEAMKLAADRDLIARQYANNFADVFDFGVPAFLHAFEKFGRVEPAIIECHLKWLAEFPDSLIARKNGLAVAEDVRRRVKQVLSLGGLDTPEGRAAGVELDRYLRSDGNKLNPGTSADLVAACLFVALRENKIAPSTPFRWDVEDWL
jgi:triphosphoribosyl-dephospho-CoA synthase